jgi:hypothetical protein
MVKFGSTIGVFSARLIVCTMLLLLIAITPSYSNELSEDQKEFADDLAQIQSNKAKRIRKEAQKQNQDSNITVAQRLSDDETETQDERIEQLEKKLESVTQELRNLKSEGMPDDRLQSIEGKLNVLAEEIDNIKQASIVDEPTYESVYGAGPAASKVYLKDRGLSIGGYGELLVGQVRADEDNIVDAQRIVFYFGYKFTERIIFNTEIEFEHATTSPNQDDRSGAVAAEFALLDFLLWPELNLRGGLLLVPFGIINEIHEPTTFFGVFRPSVERVIIPTTWRENGVGIFGDIDLQTAGSINYRAYVMNGLDARGFRASNNRGLRTRGNRGLFNDIAFVSRVEYVPLPFVSVGGSIFLGNTGQDQRIENEESPFNGDKFSGFFQMYEGDVQFQYRGFEGRALVVYTSLDDAARVNALNDLTGDDSVGDEQWGYYLVGGYNLLSLANFTNQYAQYLAPFLRWEQYDTQSSVPLGFERNPLNDRSDLTIGLNYKPIPNVVVKVEYQWLDNQANDSLNQFNFGLGYVF